MSDDPDVLEHDDYKDGTDNEEDQNAEEVVPKDLDDA